MWADQSEESRYSGRGSGRQEHVRQTGNIKLQHWTAWENLPKIKLWTWEWTCVSFNTCEEEIFGTDLRPWGTWCTAHHSDSLLKWRTGWTWFCAGSAALWAAPERSSRSVQHQLGAWRCWRPAPPRFYSSPTPTWAPLPHLPSTRWKSSQSSAAEGTSRAVRRAVQPLRGRTPHLWRQKWGERQVKIQHRS